MASDSSVFRWNNPTGGLWWHARAFRSQRAWQSTTQAIEDWLLKHSPQAKRLVIVGASAGWMLSQTWLRSFKEVHTWDVDPWARPLFHWRHGKALRQSNVQWVHHECDAWMSDRAWQDAGPDTLYWFDNVLGQLPLIMLKEEAQQRIHAIHVALKKTHWGSIHDRFSGPITGDRSVPPAWTSQSGVEASNHLAQGWLLNWGAQGDWSDHLTSAVFKSGTPVLNVAWAFKPQMGHWLEMGWQPPEL